LHKININHISEDTFCANQWSNMKRERAFDGRLSISLVPPSCLPLVSMFPAAGSLSLVFFPCRGLRFGA